VRLLGPSLDEETLPVATFTVDGTHHALVAARLSAEHGIGVRHGCFCAHPYLAHLLRLGDAERRAVQRRLAVDDHRDSPGLVRISFGAGNMLEDVDALIAALQVIVIHAKADACSHP
jgi:selenocysteine lyase/cysteine desulfurase